MAESLIGEIQVYGFNFAPYGWNFCRGQLIAIQSNTALFSLLGTYYGGDGRVTFALPDLQSRVAIGQGQGPGLSPYYIGEMAGVENTTMTIIDMPAHTHSVVGAGSPKVSSQDGTQPGPDGTNRTLGAFTDATLSATNNAYNSSTPNVALNTGSPLRATIGISGSGMPFNTMQPTLGLNYSISMYGVFPQRAD